MEEAYLLWHVQRKNAEAQKSEVLQGTLDLMVLKVLDALGPRRGYGIARRIEHRKTIARRNTIRSRKAAVNGPRVRPQDWERIARAPGAC